MKNLHYELGMHVPHVNNVKSIFVPIKSPLHKTLIAFYLQEAIKCIIPFCLHFIGVSPK